MRKASPVVIFLLLSACLLLPAQALQAGAPLKINFQGRLSESGQPAEGSKTFLFKIYDVVSGGTAVWEGASQPITLSQGVFSAELSAGTPALSTATFAGARYVEIIVDGVTLVPRQEMVSAPYALVAQALAADADIPPGAIMPGSVTDSHVALTTAAIGAGRFADDRVLITTGAFAALNGADQLVKLDASGNLPVLNGSALTNVAAASYSGAVAVSQLTGFINDNRLAISSGAFANGFNEANELLQLDASALVPVGNIPDLSAAKITGGKFYDAQVALSTGAFPGGLNGASQLLALDGSALVPVANVPDLSAAKITGGKFYDAQVALSTGAFPGGLNGASQLLALDGSALVPVAAIPDLSAAKITGGKFYDAQVALSTGAFPGGLNGASQLLALDGSALVPVANVPDLSAAKITSGKFYDAQLAISTGAFPGGFNAADQLVRLDGLGRLGVNSATVNSTLSVGGPVSLPIKTVVGDYVVTDVDSTVLVNPSAAATITLPSAIGITGRIYIIKALTLSPTVTIATASVGEDIDGGATFNFSYSNETVILQSTGSDWAMIGYFFY